MMEFGKTLRTAREAKGLTTGQIAERTHMMVQVVEGLENEDFSKIVAPIYGRGFVKLYCETVGLEPKPLVGNLLRRPRQIRRAARAGEARAATSRTGSAGIPAEADCAAVEARRAGTATARPGDNRLRRTASGRGAEAAADDFALRGADADRRRLLDARRQLEDGRPRRGRSRDSRPGAARRPCALPRDDDRAGGGDDRGRGSRSRSRSRAN